MILKSSFGSEGLCGAFSNFPLNLRQVVETCFSPLISLFWLIKMHLLLRKSWKRIYVIAIIKSVTQQGYSGKKTKTKKNKKTKVGSVFIHILKPCLLQKEPYHWVPALVFRKEGNACWQMICCCINLLQNFSSSSSHHPICTLHANPVVFSFCTHYSGPPLGVASEDCLTIHASKATTSPSQHFWTNKHPSASPPRMFSKINF